MQNVGVRDWAVNSRFGVISLVISLIEIAIVWGAWTLIRVTDPSPSFTNVLWIKVVASAWLFGTLGSFGFGIIGLIADRRRLPTAFALMAAVITFLFCGLTMVV